MTAPLKVGLVGAGGIAGAHLPAYKEYQDSVQLVAVCDVVEAAAARRAAEMGNVPYFTAIDQMLREVELDAVDICTTHIQHAPLALTAMAAGKHVLVEKPMACSMAECHSMVDAAERADVTFMVAQMQRFNPSYRGLKRLLDSGELGTIRAVRLDAMQNGPDGLRNNSWLLDGREAGGGVVISVAVHKIDLMRFLIGDVKRVTAVTRMAHPGFVNDAEDYAVALLEFENGAIGELFGTYSGFRQPWAEMFMIFGDDGTVHAVPEHGNYGGPALAATRRRLPELGEFRNMFSGFEPVEALQEELPTQAPFINEILHFAECCRNRTEPLSSGRDNLGTMKVVFGIYESARRGEPVELATL